ncbi:MAG: hypothetical protein C0467_25955 [Planctomycetaceae bacterium]|nr:hypothetical protein [Planctomycetaceae bacterium]
MVANVLRRWIRSTIRLTGFDLVRSERLAAAEAQIRQLPAETIPVLPPINLAHQHELSRRLHFAQVADHYVLMDIVGKCNLRCPSCAVGNSTGGGPAGVMKLDTFRKILDKLRADHPDKKRFQIDLFNWGEPGLHTDLPAFIRLLNDYGMNSGISSNLNVFPKLKEVIAEGPGYIRVSLSGFYNATYQRTHRGGNIHAVKANLYRLREYIDLYSARTVVQVGFHIYKSNFPHDFLRVRELCDELGFLFSPVLASFMPAEKVLGLARGSVDSADRGVLENLVIPMERQLDSRRMNLPVTTDCPLARRTTLGVDGAVSLCCAVYGQDKIVAKDYLAAPRGEIEQAKAAHPFCGDCTAHHIDQIYNCVEPAVLHEEAAAVLGPVYSAYRSQTQYLGHPDYVVLGDAFLHRDVVYARLLESLTLGQAGRDEAERCASALVDGAPDFGEGFFQAGRLAASRGERVRAEQLLARAVALTPGHDGYRAEWESVAGTTSPRQKMIPLPLATVSVERSQRDLASCG